MALVYYYFDDNPRQMLDKGRATLIVTTLMVINKRTVCRVVGLNGCARWSLGPEGAWLSCTRSDLCLPRYVSWGCSIALTLPSLKHSHHRLTTLLHTHTHTSQVVMLSILGFGAFTKPLLAAMLQGDGESDALAAQLSKIPLLG